MDGNNDKRPPTVKEIMDALRSRGRAQTWTDDDFSMTEVLLHRLAGTGLAPLADGRVDWSAVGAGDHPIGHVYSGMLLETNDGEQLGICMRDTGFELTYHAGHDVNLVLQRGDIIAENTSTRWVAVTADEKAAVLEFLKTRRGN